MSHIETIKNYSTRLQTKTIDEIIEILNELQKQCLQLADEIEKERSRKKAEERKLKYSHQYYGCVSNENHVLKVVQIFDNGKADVLCVIIFEHEEYKSYHLQRYLENDIDRFIHQNYFEQIKEIDFMDFFLKAKLEMEK